MEDAISMFSVPVWRTLGTVLALCLLTSACSVSAGLETSQEAEGFSVAASLAEIPASAIGDSRGFQVSMADVDAAAEIARVRRPAQMDDAEQLIEFVGPLTGFSRDRRLRVFVAFPGLFIRNTRDQEALIEEFGFGLGEIRTFSVLEASPAQFMVLTGVETRSDLPEIAPGILTVGEGEDFENDLELRSTIRLLGRPHRVAVDDDRVAISLETAPLVTWADDSPHRTLADDGSLLAIAQLLDELNIVSATINTFDGASGLAYEAAGIGWTEDDQGPLSAIVLSYPSIGDAAQNLDAVSASLEPDSQIGEQLVSDLVTLDSIELRGAEIVAVVRFLPDTNPSLPLNMLFRLEGPFGS